MSKAKPITRVHTRSEQTRLIRVGKGRRYLRANSPELVHGEQGTRTENIRGRFSTPNPSEDEDLREDRQIRARSLGRRNKMTAQVASLRKR